MFIVIASVPRFGSRDEYVGERRYVIPGLPAYETLAWADLMALRQDDGDPSAEVSYYVADAADEYRLPVKRAQRARVTDWDDDLPF